MAIKMFEGDVAVEMKMQTGEDGGTIPMMPNDPFHFVDEFKEIVERANRHGVNYLRHSLVHQFNVNRLPLKLCSHPNAAIARKLSKSMDGLRALLPKELLRANIGSNRDLFRVMRKIHDEMRLNEPDHNPSHAKCLIVDCNIFSRTFKVLAHPRNDVIVSNTTHTLQNCKEWTQHTHTHIS